MGKDTSNGLILSSKKATCRFRGEKGREIERLQAALEAEKSRGRQAHRRYSAELKRQREAAERERQKAVRDLTHRYEREKALELLRLREALGKEREAEVRQLLRWKGGGSPQKERESAVRQARELYRQLARELAGKPGPRSPAGRKCPGQPSCLSNVVIYHRLEQLLTTLQWEAHGEQSALVRRLRQELDLEKNFFLRHLLEAHSWAEPESSCSSSKRRSVSCAQLHRPPKADPDSSFGGPRVSRSRSSPQKSRSASPGPRKKRGEAWSSLPRREQFQVCRCSSPLKETSCSSVSSESRSTQTSLSSGGTPLLQNSITESAVLEESSRSRCSLADMENMNGTDYGYLVRQNSELLRALGELEKTCAALKEENGLLRKSSSPETEEKVKRLKRKNTELAVIAKRLEERARKLQEANLKVVNAPASLKAGAVEQYKRAFARQRARDLAQHADTLLSKDKEIAVLQQECRELQARLSTGKGSPSPSGIPEFERLLRESQREVLRLQRQLSVSSVKEPVPGSAQEKVTAETPLPAVDEAPAGCEETPGEEEKQKRPVSPEPPPCLSQEGQPVEQRLQLLVSTSLHSFHSVSQILHSMLLSVEPALMPQQFAGFADKCSKESELSKKRKECESLEHEVKKRQKRCLDLESQLEDERAKNEQVEQEADHLRQKVQLLDQVQVENEVLREDLSEVTAQRNSVLEENQRLRAKLENLEQVLKHMREVAERRQQLELEHEQALAILKFKQDEIKRLQRAQFFAKREHEGVVQMLEELIQLVLQRELGKVRELEEKCRNQSEQFGLLSHELERFRHQAGKMDLGGSSTLSNPGLSHLTNGVGLAGERDLGPALRSAAAPHTAGLGKTERSPTIRHRELPTISVKSGSTSSTPKSESKHLTPKSESLPHSPRKSSPTHEVDTASEVEELDIDVSPIPYPGSRVTAKLQVFIARYSYNPYDGPNDNPEVELPLTAGEYIYVYGDMDDDGFYEGELMDGRRGLVPSNFVERVSDDDMMSFHPPEVGDISHNSFQESSFLSSSEKHLRFSIHNSERTEPSAAAELSAGKGPAPMTNGLDLDMEEVGVDTVPYPRKLTLIKQLAKSIIIGWDAPLVPAGWGSIWSYNVYVDKELRFNIPFGSQTKAVLERMDLNLKTYRVSVQSLTEKGNSDQLRCTLLVGRDVCVAPTQLRVERIAATSANLTWLPSNSNYVHIVSLNDEECELVKAGSYSLCLSNLKPNLQYWVKVEAKPHRTPWELPLERRERKSATTSFTTLMAGPPDAPLDVQLEKGPSPGIALITWLPVTIDAAGTSNGVRVTGYTIYADKKKVLEVSSPTAGSALLGPSQIQTLQTAHELTVRTMSPHGESADSVPVKVLAKLMAITAGMAPPQPSVPAVSSVDPAAHPTPLPIAKTPTLLHNSPLEGHCTPIGASAEASKTDSTESVKPSYVEAWANPSSGIVPRDPPAVQVSPASLPRSSLAVSATLSSGADDILDSSKGRDSPGVKRPAVSISDFLEEAVSSTELSAHAPSTPAPNTPPPSTPSPVIPALLTPTPSPSKAPPVAPVPEIDPLNPPETHPLRPVNPSPLESEAEDESSRENSRLVSIEEFLDQGQHRRAQGHDGSYLKRRQDYSSGQLEPLSEYQAESSRGSDLSDILEEEEEDLYSDPMGEERSRGYSTAVAGRPDVWEADSDEEILEKILKLPAQASHSKQLFSIPEVTEEEDNSQELEEATTRTSPQMQHHPLKATSNFLPAGDGSLNDTYRSSEDLRYSTLPVRSKQQFRVHYSDTIDTINYQEAELDADGRVYFPGKDVWVRKPHESGHKSYSGDRLRREALLRSQMSSDLAASGQQLRTAGRPQGSGLEIDIEYGTEDDEESAPYNPGEAAGAERAASEWWAEGGSSEGLEELSSCSSQFESLPLEARRIRGALGPYSGGRGPTEAPPQDYHRSPLRSAKPEHSAKVYTANDGHARVCFLSVCRNGGAATEALIVGQETLGNGDLQLAEAGASWYGQTGLSPKQAGMEERHPKDAQQGLQAQRPAADGEVRIFVALFPYDPAVMSPNPDAAEEELPFREGQIIKVYGEKDADGFYRGESGGRFGYVPCNMVSEIQVEDEETKDQLLLQGFLPAEASMEKIGTRSHAQLPRRPVPPPKPRRTKKAESAGVWEDSVDSSRGFSQPPPAPQSQVPRRMVAVFDYDPRESSPNADIEAELTFSAGDVIYVFGDMDDDGFFYGDLNGQKGLVPSNFLQALPEAGDEAAGGAAVDLGTSESRRESQRFRRRLSVHSKPKVVPSDIVAEVSVPVSVGFRCSLFGSVLLRLTVPCSLVKTRRNIRGNATIQCVSCAEGPQRVDLERTEEAIVLIVFNSPQVSLSVSEEQSAPPAVTEEEPSPAPDPAPSTAPPQPLPAESPMQTDTSPPGKKKRGFFSKGKKLFKKLGSSKKD
ncbi:peripheral-type benzodiazepine receptor-associated protein 1-like [Megalops cyprinoides]|uniref:peripheral-type benzodiazepine receptor-associated protein 1-like n=1 Tax=Megalops cyprinoides TaxID=118141 RepID=UPI0018647EE2|nr:peripheral-type benzodiazepine receptor-associated protein 1-like [Megalops cyprinoides]